MRDPALLEMMAASGSARMDEAESLGRLKVVSSARLLKIIETKVRTAFVAPLAQIEEHFGVLWGKKRRPEEMTPQERQWWERYQAAREKILTNGNNQIRAMQAEVCLYEIEYKGYRNTLTVLGTQEERTE
jgi:hypothetical protein